MKPSDINTLQIEPTTYCNARCPHCARFDVRGNLHPSLTLQHLDIEAIKNNIEIDQLCNLKTVVLEGDKGDPAMHPDIEKIISFFSYAPSAPQVILYTNGSIRSPKWWEALAKHGYSNLKVVFSIDGLRDTNHLYRVGLDFNTILNNVKSFIVSGGDAIWKMILFRHNEHQLNEISEFSKKLGFSKFAYVPCRMAEFQGNNQWPVIIDGQVTHYLEPPLVIQGGMNNHKPDVKEPDVKITSYPDRICPNLTIGKIYITHQNYVVPCCSMHFDTQLDYNGKSRLEQMSGGFDNQDLTKQSLTTILNNQLFKTTLIDSLHSGQWHYNCVRNCKNQIINNLKFVKNYNNL